MIVSFRHKGLRRLFEDDDRSGLSADRVEKIRLILSALDQAEAIEDLNQPAFRLHALKGDLKGFWSITVRANWRIIFRFAGESASDVDLTDYH
jgi:proteic killer suppression protein